MMRTGDSARQLVLLLSVVSATLLPAATLEVGEGKAYSDIQSAIDAASDGDEIVVGDGIWEVAAEISLTKGIAVRSANGRDVTHVSRVRSSGEKVARVVSIDHAAATFSGFTIRDGYVDQNDASSTSTWPGAGAGVRIGANGGTLSDCVVSNNVQKADVSSAAGVASLGPAGVVSNCVIVGNQAFCASDIRCYGFAVCMYGGELVDTEISENSSAANYVRGSVALRGGAKMRRCVVRGNAAPNAKYFDWGPDWQATAGVYVFESGSLVENCLIAENVSKNGTSRCGSGGGLVIDQKVAAEVVNCTIVRNTAGVGGGVWNGSTDATFVNCIIQDNTGDSGVDFYGIEKAVGLNNICPDAFTKQGSTNNLDGAVVFKRGTYEPMSNQISHDAGTTNGCPWLAETVDLKGNARLLDDAVDVGCYEFTLAGYEVVIVSSADDVHIFKDTTLSFSAGIFPVPVSATYLWTVDGVAVSSAATFARTFSAYGSSTIGLTVTIDGDVCAADDLELTVLPRVMYVVNAALHPNHQPVAPYDSPAKAALSPLSAMAYGRDDTVVKVSRGVYELEGELIVDRGVRYESVEGPDKTVLHRKSERNGLVVERVASVTHAAGVLSGFTLENGYIGEANGCGGVLIERGLVTNCVVRDCQINTISGYGAGVMLTGGVLVDSVVRDNLLSVNDMTYRQSGGAGVCMRAGRLLRCRIVGNRSEVRAGAEVKGRMQTGCGVLLQDGEMTGCLVAENVSPDFPGAGMVVEATVSGGRPVVSNCTFAANHTEHGAGGVLAAVGASEKNAVSFVNCCFAANEGEAGMTDVSLGTGIATFAYCFGPAGQLPDGEGNVFGTDAKLLMSGGSSYRPLAGSPLIGAGVYGDWMDKTVDLRGRPRVVDPQKVTIGCYQVDPIGAALFLR